ncbi:MAG TPA: cytochrome c [Rubrivivax sp.]|nr:cytochrome c [Rubrivivax sp.]
MTRRLVILALTAATTLLTGLPAAAQQAASPFAKPEDAVKYRKAAFTLMGAHFSRIGAMAQGRVPFDGAAAAANADLVVALSNLPYAGFMEGTHNTDKGGAKANIWTERAKFDEGAKKMQDEVTKLAAAARTNNLDNVKAAFGNAANSCKACHDNYRNN